MFQEYSIIQTSQNFAPSPQKKTKTKTLCYDFLTYFTKSNVFKEHKIISQLQSLHQE